MKMKINNHLLKETRNNRCWSQEQLAEMTGLSLRTVQRIEAKGVASKESIKSLAAVLELTSTDLILVKENVSMHDTENAAIGDARVNRTMAEGTEAAPLTTIKLKKQYIWGMFVVIVANLGGFFGIYHGYTEGKINQETMVLFTNIVSGALLLSTSLLTFKAWRQGIFKFEL